MRNFIILGALAIIVGGVIGAGCKFGEKTREIFNVSYDPTRELYDDYNKLFAEHWFEKTGETILVEKSNGGSGAQARAVKTGQEADVVTLALAYDVDVVASGGLLKEGAEIPESPDYWQKRLPNNSCPYTSTIIILVRKGNPKNVKDWDDLAREDVKVVTPNPKTSGGAKWNYLALWGYALDKALADDGGLNAFVEGKVDATKVEQAQQEAFEFTKKVFANAFRQGMQAGARGATDDFVKNGVGDAFIAWENEALMAKNYSKDELEIVVPKLTIKAEPPVAVVDKVVDRKGTRDIAEEYLKFLFDPQAQEVVAKRHYRPYLPEVMEKYKDQFPETTLFTLDDVFGGWANVQKTHFDPDGYFEKMLLEFAQKQ